MWGYVISHARRGRVELNPRKLADTLGGKMEEIEGAIKYLMRPDARSRHKSHEGRRLIKEGEFQYWIPSWEDYQEIKREDDRREYNRRKQAEYRARKRPVNGKPLAGEMLYEKTGQEPHEFREETVPYQVPPSP